MVGPCWGWGWLVLREIDAGRALPFLRRRFYERSLRISDFRDSRFPEASSFIDTLLTLMSLTFLANMSVDLV